MLKGSNLRSAVAASTEPAQVRKSFAVKWWPLMSRRYSFTSVGVDVVLVAVVVEVLEELVAGDVFATLDDVGEAPVLEADGVVDAALALKGEGDLGAVHLDVLVAAWW